MKKLLAIVGIALLLAACGDSTPPQVPSDRIVTVKVAVPIQPIKPSDIPPFPPQLGPAPADARDGEAKALAGFCAAIKFIADAYPLLETSAGISPIVQAPDYPQCDKRPPAK